MNEPPATRTELWRTRLGRFRQRLQRAAPFASGVLAALLAILLYHIIFPGSHQLTASELNNTVALAMASATPAPAYSARVYQIIQPSLVLVQTQEVDATGAAQHSLGSGVVVDTAGDILTSLHVVASASDVLVTFADGTQSSAQVLVRQPQNDIAVLRADQPPAQLFPAVLGNPNRMHVGDEAYVLGNPFGLYGSMSAGVISGFNRTFQPPFSNQKLQGLIQIDAAVNPGNSGGPLLNRDGEVIGIIEGIINPTQGDFFIGIGFAVPIAAAGGAAGLPPY
jgi:S1-C subfamily serine protease